VLELHRSPVTPANNDLLDAVIVAAGRFLASPNIGFRSTVTGRPVCVVVIDAAVRTVSRSAGDLADRCHFVVTRRYSSGLLNFAAHSPEDSQRNRKCRSARLKRPVPKGLFQYRTAARRAFSPTSHITQRDGGIGMRRAAAPSCAPATETAQDCSTATFQGRPSWMIPGWRPSPVPGSPEVSMHPADIPAIREPIHEPWRHPGVPAGVLAHPLRRDPRPASPRATGPSAAGTTDGMPAPRQSGRPLGSPDALLHRGPLRSVRATRRGIRLKQAPGGAQA
jgi:hypothetical protein